MKALVINCYQDNYYLSSLHEMENLLYTLDIDIEDVCQGEVKEISRATFISRGYIDKARLQMINKDIDIIVFNNDLSPLQIRNLTEAFNKEIYDRSMIIIKIFELRASSKEAKLQVEIASLRYNASRLVDSSSNYDQISSKGGMTNRGLGEKIIQLKRSLIRKEIAKKEKELEIIENNRSKNRLQRKTNLPLVVITGYTNAGKSTLMNHFIKLTDNKRKDLILQEDRLFATLNTTTRLIKSNQYFPFLLTDTVGFISNLPTHLIKAFRSTLEELQEADLVIEVIDVSSPLFKQEIEITERLVKEVSRAKVVRLYNKIDKLESPFFPMMEENELMVSLNDDSYIDQIQKVIDENLSSFYLELSLFIPYEDSDIYYEIKNNQSVISTIETETGYDIVCKIFKTNFNRYKKYLKGINLF